MTLIAPLWTQAGEYDADEDRGLISSLFTDGVLGDGLEVTERAAGTNMSVDVAAGTCVIAGDDTANQGAYLCRSTAIVNVVLDAAPGVGNDRIDRIVAQVRDSTVLGSGPDDWTITAVTGTPAGSPSAPALPDSAISLALVDVGSGVVTIADADITDARVSGGVSTGALADGAVTNDQIGDGTIGTAKIAEEEWTAYTPTLGGGASAFSLGNGVLTGRYLTEGNRITYAGKITLGSTSSWGGGTGLTATLPVTAKVPRGTGAATYFDNSGDAPRAGTVWISTTSAIGFAASAGHLTATVPITWNNNDEIHWTIVYEAA